MDAAPAFGRGPPPGLDGRRGGAARATDPFPDASGAARAGEVHRGVGGLPGVQQARDGAVAALRPPAATVATAAPARRLARSTSAVDVVIWAVGGVVRHAADAVRLLRATADAARRAAVRRGGAAAGARHPPSGGRSRGRAPGMPMTFGVFRPTVLLPAARRLEPRAAARGAAARAGARAPRRRRHPPAGSHGAGLYWWNPLAWFAWREFLKERERATDDLVLHAGERASDYAGHLLEVARTLQPAPATAWAAIAMARRSQLEGRLIAILDSDVRRKPSGRGAPAAAAVIAIALVAPFAAMQAQDPRIPPRGRRHHPRRECAEEPRDPRPRRGGLREALRNSTSRRSCSKTRSPSANKSAAQ